MVYRLFSVFGPDSARARRGLDGDPMSIGCGVVANRQRALEVRVKREKYGEKGAVRARARADV